MRAPSPFVVAVAAALSLAAPRSARAGGGLFAPRAASLPSVAVERALLVHDEKAGVEHLIREVTFTNVDRPFGFIVPTPEKPGVFKADNLAWSALERKLPFEVPENRRSDGAPGLDAGPGSGGGVRVLSAKRVGSFAAFVLQATDGKSLRGWLDRNKLVTAPASEAWLDRYVKLNFYFVALRFEPSLFAAKRDPRGSTPAETLRITFETPVPYYPYQEPDRDDLTDGRALALWLVTNGKPKVPVALVRDGDSLSYRRPFREGARRPSVLPRALAEIIGDKTWKTVAPAGDTPLTIQVFEDQKRTRKGFGDVLLVPEEPVTLSPAAIEKQKALLPLLDPGLENR